jgi:uncharacterized pyridoxal phosphate-containing UPF0001 family protein
MRAEMESLLALPRLSIGGLMIIPPLAEEAEASRTIAVAVRDALEEFDLKLPLLSMGMTNDFTVAIQKARRWCASEPRYLAKPPPGAMILGPASVSSQD